MFRESPFIGKGSQGVSKDIHTDPLLEQDRQRYERHFLAPIAELKQRIASTPVAKDALGFLGEGDRGTVYRLAVSEKEYAVKLFYQRSEQEYEIPILSRMRGIAHTPQMVAYSLEDQAIVMEVLPGVTLESLPAEPPFVFSKEEMLQCIETIQDLYDAGLTPDIGGAGNFLYDSATGFSILDPYLKPESSRSLEESRPVESYIMELHETLSTRNYPAVHSKWHLEDDEMIIDYDEESKRNLMIRYHVELPTRIRFFRLIKEHFPKMFSEWKQDRDKRINAPRGHVIELTERSMLATLPQLEPYVRALEELGI